VLVITSDWLSFVDDGVLFSGGLVAASLDDVLVGAGLLCSAVASRGGCIAGSAGDAFTAQAASRITAMKMGVNFFHGNQLKLKVVITK
jgi:hypothetical protein